MSSKLDLDPGVIASCRQAAAQIAGQVGEEIAHKTTVSVERTVARLLGVDGANELDAPLPNVLVDHVRTAESSAGASPTGSATRCWTTSALPAADRRGGGRGRARPVRARRARRRARSGHG